MFDCTQQADYASCPRMCGVPCASSAQTTASTATTVAAGTTAPVTTGTLVVTTLCPTLACAYGQTFDSATCKW